MDKKYQDITIVDKNYHTIKLAVPRMSKLISIFFDEDAVIIHYVNNDGYYDIKNIAYEQLNNGFKLIID